MISGSIVSVFHIAAIHTEGVKVFSREVTRCSNSLLYARILFADIKGASCILWIRIMTASHPHTPASCALEFLFYTGKLT